MKIVVTGTRGIPNIMDVTDDNRRDEYRGVKLKDVYAPRKKSLEAIVHTFLAVIAAKRMKADILHVHAVGPSIVVPFARLLGMKVVMTHHGPDYDRDKWGKLARAALKLGERNGAKFSNEVVAISNVIVDILQSNYGRRSNLIFNGVNRPVVSGKTDYVESLGLEPGRYVVAVGRFVKEKCFDQLIEAYGRIAGCGFKLAIAGDADHEDEYSRSLKAMAHDRGVVLTGFIRGERMSQLMSHAALFVLPSSHEGLPISLLEAMSYGRDVLVSDIPANKLPELEPTDFFPCGNVDALRQAIERKLQNVQSARAYDLHNYDWDNIARQTVAVYRKIM